MTKLTAILIGVTCVPWVVAMCAAASNQPRALPEVIADQHTVITWEKSIERPEAVIGTPIAWEEKHPFIADIVMREFKIYSQRVAKPVVKEKKMVCGEFEKEQMIDGYVKRCEWVDVEE